jgi:hypothetical protein
MRGRRRRVFLSHAWARDELGRDTHARVRALGAALRRRGWDAWVDEDVGLVGRLDAALADGLRASDALVVGVTRAYDAKVERAAASPALVEDACLMELALAAAWRVPVVPAILEPAARDSRRWGAVLCMRLHGQLHVDATADDPEPGARALHLALCRLFGGGAPLAGGRVLARRRRHPPTSSSSSSLSSVRV